MFNLEQKKHEFIMELPPEAKVLLHKGQFIVAHADSEPFAIVGKKAKVIRCVRAK